MLRNSAQGYGKKSNPPVGDSGLPIPDPRRWPRNIRARLRAIKGEHASPWDVAIIDSGESAGMWLEDAVTALGLLDVAPSAWNVDGGYPIFTFDSRRIDEYSECLTACGFRVRVFTPKKNQEVTRRVSRAQVIDIATARAKARAAGASL